MATSDTKTMIEGAVARLVDEVPALRNLAMVFRLELRERGGPAVWRVETPGPKVSRDPRRRAGSGHDRPAGVQHPGREGTPRRTGSRRTRRASYASTGDQNVIKLIARVIELRRSRQR